MSILNKPTQANMLETIADLKRYREELERMIRVRGEPKLPFELLEGISSTMSDAAETLEQAEYWLRPVGSETR